MGLFFKKKTREYICPVCGKTDNYQFAAIIKDHQKLCRECTWNVDISSSMLPFQSVEDIKKHFIFRDENLNIFKNFSTTREVKCSYGFFREDAKLKKWYFCVIHKGIEPSNPTLYNYEDIIDYELTIDGDQVAKGGLGSAIAGGLMFGDAGAIVGSNIGKRITSSIIKSMKIRISLNHPYISEEIVVFATHDGIKVGGYDYNKFKTEADNTISFLDSLCAKAAAEKALAANTAQPSAISSADEILKYKNLLDSGIISQEEFDSKKKQLLGL